MIAASSPPLLTYRSLVPRGEAALLLAAMVAASLTEGIGIVLLVPILNTLQGSSAMPGAIAWLAASGLPSSLGGLLAAFVVLVGLRSAVLHGREMLAANMHQTAVDRLRLRCYGAVLTTEWRWLAVRRKSDIANLLLTEIGRVGSGVNFGIGLAASLLTMTAYLLAALALSWKITALAMASGGLVFFGLARHRRKALVLGQALGNANRALQASTHESLAGIKLAKILGNESRHLERFQSVAGDLRDRQLRFTADTSLSRALFQAGGATLLAAYIYVGVAVWAAPLSALLTLVLVFARLIPLFGTVQQQYHHCLHALPALDEIGRLLDDCAAAAEPAAAGMTPWPVRKEIRLDGATVRYADRGAPALDGVDIVFPVRTTTAVMGASGAGKSTLADVMMGLLEPDGGHLSIDGVPVAGAARLRWRHAVAYVPQESFLFHDTIRANLLWGAPEADEPALRDALRRAAADFVTTLPQGLDTVVGDGGVLLSGGERQRLALARALLKRPSLLILDEATSALDAENEARVRKAVADLHGNLTVVIIGHRPSMAMDADQVVVMAQGRVAAAGRWDDVRSAVEGGILAAP